ncbi:MAG: hypothetical protein R3E93_11485 [Thiothrix sp.]
MQGKELLDRLYDYVTGDEDARVCKDIPTSACHHQPRNFFAYLVANLLNKVADEISSAKLVLPWLLGTLGAPLAFTGFLVPIREAGALLPQLIVAALVRKQPKRKGVWLLGALLSALALAVMAWTATGLEGAAAGWMVVLMLVLFSLARGLCSVSAKDVLGKTVSKSRRGVLMGWSASLGGVAVLLIGLWLGASNLENVGKDIFVWLLGGASVLWLLALLVFATIREEPGATEGGGNALTVALQSLALLKTDAPFRRFVIARTWLLSVALSPPFLMILAQQHTSGGIGELGWLIVATGLGSAVSSPFWGKLGDQSSKTVMAMAATGSGVLCLLVWLAVTTDFAFVNTTWFWGLVMIALTVLHSGIRLGRKVYLVDMATAETRASYVAVSNTVIGVMMLVTGVIGLLGDWFGAGAVVLLLGVLALVAAGYAKQLPEVSEP